MSDDSGFTYDDDGLSRREALSRLVGTPVSLGVLWTLAGDSVGAQLAAPRNLRIVGNYEATANSPIALGQHPRTFLTPATTAALRTQIATDAAFRARWQQAVTQFEAAGGYWATNSTNPLTNAFA